VSTTISPLAGRPAPTSLLVDVSKLVAAYSELRPDPSLPAQQVAFGTSGHRGSSFDRSFNEWHVLAISQALCEYRKSKQITGPLYIGFDTHALSQPAFESALEVLAANDVETMIARGGEFTPTPAVSHAILGYWPTASSSRLRTIRPTTAASSTTRPTAARPMWISPTGSRIARTL
jgi:phosphoglucomutase